MYIIFFIKNNENFTEDNDMAFRFLKKCIVCVLLHINNHKILTIKCCK